MTLFKLWLHQLYCWSSSSLHDGTTVIFVKDGKVDPAFYLNGGSVMIQNSWLKTDPELKPEFVQESDFALIWECSSCNESVNNKLCFRFQKTCAKLCRVIFISLIDPYTVVPFCKGHPTCRQPVGFVGGAATTDRLCTCTFILYFWRLSEIQCKLSYMNAMSCCKWNKKKKMKHVIYNVILIQEQIA